jgi:hypothetical protein
LILRFLANALPEWAEGSHWVQETLLRIAADLKLYPGQESAPNMRIVGSLLVSMSYNPGTFRLAVSVVGI